MTMFTQSDLDEVLNGLFGVGKISELWLDRTNGRWHAECALGVSAATGDTPAEAIRAATAALVAARLTK